MKRVVIKIGDAIGVFSPFIAFIFICAAYLHQPANNFSQPAEKVKQESSKKETPTEEYEYGRISFVLQ